MTFLLFVQASTKWLGGRKDRKSRRDSLGRFCDRYLAVKQYVGCLSHESKVWRVSHTRVHKSLIGTLARHSFSLFDRYKV